MNHISRTSKATTCLFFLFIFLYIFVHSTVDRSTTDLSAYYAPILPFLVAFLLAILVIFVVIRTMVVASITVLVLLAFSGKRRKVLAEEGSKITSDVAFYFVKVVVKDKGLVAFGCATIVSASMMAWLRIMGDQVYV
ncbi:Unknown protein [Striga hermonthica]|uniref:Uncharacterized protein n=1 Tax=Striga hermonthica TaxID=68872 RepID=A0A9N7R878_STRHE|nr:Unknown protein [Striga hermonthica]